GELLRISLGRVEGGYDGPQIGIKHNRGALQVPCLGSLSGIGRPSSARSGNENVSKEIAAMELDREVGIFEGMARQDQNDGIARFDESASVQLLESSQGDGGGRFATDAIGADFGLSSSDFDFRDFFDFTGGR